MANTKKTSWVLLYLVAIVPVGLSLYFYMEKNLLAALITSSISFLIYTFLIIKDLRFLSSISFLTMFFISLLTLGISGNKTGDVFPSIINETAFMLAMSLILSFLLVNSAYWAKTKQGIKKLISLACISLSVLMLAAFGTGSPAFYQNFVYSRINILILLIFSIYLIVKRKKFLGILGIVLSIGILLLSASMFAEKTYTLNDEEQKEAVVFIDPVVKEMFGYYNKEDYVNFCKYCGFLLKSKLNSSPIKNNRDAYGPYVYFDEPSNVYRKGGRFYVEYPVKLQNVKGITYITFVLENITSDISIYGFAFSDKSEQQ